MICYGKHIIVSCDICEKKEELKNDSGSKIKRRTKKEFFDKLNADGWRKPPGCEGDICPECVKEMRGGQT